MLNKILAFAEKYNMFPSGTAVVCGLSGGADSVCLVLCLNELKTQLGIQIEALHVNHCLRDAESNRDEEFCRSFCAELGVAFNAVTCDVKAFAKENSLSVEEAARKMRYDAFAANSDGKIIATAHNANDNLETLILNIARGTGLKGLAGIPPVRDNIVRPLLTISREEIEAFLLEHNIEYVTDSTNLSDDYTRNKIRHAILPLLTEINSSVVKTSINTIDTIRNENDLIEQQVADAYTSSSSDNSLCGLDKYSEVIRRRCIAKLLSKNSLPYSHERLEAADNITLQGGKINISNDWYLISDKKTLRLEKISCCSNQIELSTELKHGKNTIFDDKALYTEYICGKHLIIDDIVNTKLAIYYLDCDKIIGRAFLRNRRFGDKIKLSGKSFTSSVKKLINELIPAEQREKLHFIEDEKGTVFAEGIGIADRAAPDDNTVNYLKITLRKE